MNPNNGGPAFPRDAFYPGLDGSVKHRGGTPGNNGMSLRDWFAGQIMAAFCANPVTNSRYGGDPWPDVVGKLAESAYEAADAMLDAREGRDS